MSALQAEAPELDELPVHPVADHFPLLRGAKLAALADSIRTHGLNRPGVVHEGQLIDGRNRREACAIAGVPFEVRPWEGHPDGVEAWILAENVDRRHLSPSQAALVAARMANATQGSHKKCNSALLTLEEAAKRMNVSRRLAAEARYVLRSGRADLVDLIDADEVTVSRVAADLRAELAPPSSPEALLGETADTLDLPPDDPAHTAPRAPSPEPAPPAPSSTVTALVRIAAEQLADAGATTRRTALATLGLRRRVEAEAGPVSSSTWTMVLHMGAREGRWAGDGDGLVWLPEESLPEPGSDLDIDDEIEGDEEEEESPAYTAVTEAPPPPTTVRRRPAPEPPPAMPPDDLPLPNDERAPFDAYYTPDAHARAAVRWLMLRLDGWLPGNLAAVEPSVGAGAWARALAAECPGASCDVVDIDPLAPGLAEAAPVRAHCADWLKGPLQTPHGRWRERLLEATTHDPWDLCLGNPPYDREIVVPFIERCLARARVVALLMRGTFPGSLGRREFWRAHRPAYIVNVSPRPLWEGPGARDATDSMDPVLIVWVRGWDDPHTRYEWLYLDDEAQP